MDLFDMLGDTREKFSERTKERYHDLTFTWSVVRLNDLAEKNPTLAARRLDDKFYGLASKDRSDDRFNAALAVLRTVALQDLPEAASTAGLLFYRLSKEIQNGPAYGKALDMAKDFAACDVEVGQSMMVQVHGGLKEQTAQTFDQALLALHSPDIYDHSATMRHVHNLYTRSSDDLRRQVFPGVAKAIQDLIRPYEDGDLTPVIGTLVDFFGVVPNDQKESVFPWFLDKVQKFGADNPKDGQKYAVTMFCALSGDLQTQFFASFSDVLKPMIGRAPDVTLGVLHNLNYDIGWSLGRNMALGMLAPLVAELDRHRPEQADALTLTILKKLPERDATSSLFDALSFAASRADLDPEHLGASRVLVEFMRAVRAGRGAGPVEVADSLDNSPRVTGADPQASGTGTDVKGDDFMMRL